jgi:hypothetical protein
MWVSPRAALLWGSLVCQALAGWSDSFSHLNHARPRGSLTAWEGSLSPSVTARNASSNDIDVARKIVKDAIARMTELNKARLAKPYRNNYNLKPGTKVSKRDDGTLPRPLLDVTDEIARAAALIAELDADTASDGTSNANPPLEKRAGTFWMESIARKGSVPWGNDASYKVRILDVDTGTSPLRLLIQRDRFSEMLSKTTALILRART